MTKKKVHEAFKKGSGKALTEALIAYYQKINFYKQQNYQTTKDFFDV